jgi:hypothetical protein
MERNSFLGTGVCNHHKVGGQIKRALLLLQPYQYSTELAFFQSNRHLLHAKNPSFLLRDPSIFFQKERINSDNGPIHAQVCE